MNVRYEKSNGTFEMWLIHFDGADTLKKVPKKFDMVVTENEVGGPISKEDFYYAALNRNYDLKKKRKYHNSY